jgi:Fuc2NAc and GlcNAc transferase
MSIPLAAVIGVAVFVAAAWLTERFRRIALAHDILDVPTPRASHHVAMPRGGGVAIVLVTAVAISLLGISGLLPWPLTVALVGGGTLVALVGLLDDLKNLPQHWRLLGHFAAAVWVYAWLGGLPPLPDLTFLRAYPVVGHILGTLYVVWLLNLTNFMDGIDGIAASEAVVVCLGGVLLYALSTPSSAGILATLVLGAAACGFLIWNWPPARIFMGDAGSGFLGFMFAALSLYAGWVEPQLFWAWVILLGVFITDATVTLVHRVARGQRFNEAHRSHAYQRAARRWGAHRRVTVAVAMINVFWLLPMAALVALGTVGGLVGTLIAYTPLVVSVVALGAGGESS